MADSARRGRRQRKANDRYAEQVWRRAAAAAACSAAPPGARSPHLLAAAPAGRARLPDCRVRAEGRSSAQVAASPETAGSKLLPPPSPSALHNPRSPPAARIGSRARAPTCSAAGPETNPTTTPIMCASFFAFRRTRTRPPRLRRTRKAQRRAIKVLPWTRPSACCARNAKPRTRTHSGTCSVRAHAWLSSKARHRLKRVLSCNCRRG